MQSTPFHGAEEHADNRCKKNLLIMRASRIVLWKLMTCIKSPIFLTEFNRREGNALLLKKQTMAHFHQ